MTAVSMFSPDCTLEINLKSIQANYQILKQLCKHAEVAACVKANTYGIGADKVIPALQAAGCTKFFVFSLDEGIIARKATGPKGNIFILTGAFSATIKELKNYELIPVLNHLSQLKIWQELAVQKGINLPCILHFNTGMNRLGMSGEEIEELISKPALLEFLDVKYIMSHLAASEKPENPYNSLQLEKFKYYLQSFPNIKASLANSSGIFLGEDYHFDLVRSGLALYGGNPIPDKPNPMRAVIKLTAPIIQLQQLAANSCIGYNMTFTTKRDSIIATLPLGYADGISRYYSNKGIVYIDGCEAPIVGRVSMDLITIDVTDVPREKIFLGQKVEIIGDNCTIDKIASINSMIGYEILTKLGSRYKRIYKPH